MNELGFYIEEERLRIPSTKNLCLFSRQRTPVDQEIVDAYCSVVPKIRKSDFEKTQEYLKKKQAREMNKSESEQTELENKVS